MSAKELFVSDYPIYSIGRLGDEGGEFYVAGGGGTSKTGIPNSLDVYKLSCDGGECVSIPFHHHDMGTGVIMNSATHPKKPHQLAVGVGAECLALELTEEVVDSPKKKESKLRKRKKSKSDKEEEEEKEEDSGGNLGQARCVTVLSQKRTDFSSENYQKVVAFSCDGERVVTGGCDGVVRVWKYPSLEKECELSGHQSEIETISCHPSKQQVVSGCRGGRGIVWDLTNHDEENSFMWSPGQRSRNVDKTSKPTHRFRACCFSPAVEDSSLYTLSIPIDKSKKKQKCYLVKWDAGPWIMDEFTATGVELVSALAIDRRGNYLGVGTLNGNVLIYSSSLKLYCQVPAVHNVFVTGLLFLPILPPGPAAEKETKETERQNSPDKKLVSSKLEKLVLVSISVDRTCNAILVKKKSGMSRFTILILVILSFVILGFIFTTKYYQIW